MPCTEQVLYETFMNSNVQWTVAFTLATKSISPKGIYALKTGKVHTHTLVHVVHKIMFKRSFGTEYVQGHLLQISYDFPT